MSALPRASALAPFKIKSFRFQWPADLATSFALEMEIIILGWYVLVETQSVFLLTVYASLHHLGTLLGPFFGVAGDRLGQRNMLFAMRVFYTLMSATLMVCVFAGVISPMVVLAIATFSGLVRPSDIGIRNAVISEIMPPNQLLSATGLQRTTQDTARIAGALTGAGLVTLLGMAPAYVVITCLYATSALLTLLASRSRVLVTNPAAPILRESPWRELKEGVRYVLRTPHIMGVMVLAVLLNGTAFPIYMSLLPYVVKEVYADTQTTLGYMVAIGSLGALLASLLVSRFNARVSPGRLMFLAASAWLLMLLLFGQMKTPAWGAPFLFLAGMAQACSLVPMTTILLRYTEPAYRGRVMGIRMLMIYSNMPGILLFGPIVTHIGYAQTMVLYCVFGLTCLVAIGMFWREHLWIAGARANAR
ncbi:MAG: MFS transporter [Burkholderiales bacterium]